MRDVEALQVLNRTLEAEGLTEATSEVLGLRSRSAKAQFECRAGVVAGEFHPSGSGTSFGRGDLYSAFTLVGEPRSEELAIILVQIGGGLYRTRDGGVGLVVLGGKAGQQLGGADIAHSLEVELAFVHQLAVAVGEDADGGVL
jgi:hypothetical protein